MALFQTAVPARFSFCSCVSDVVAAFKVCRTLAARRFTRRGRVSGKACLPACVGMEAQAAVSTR